MEQQKTKILYLITKSNWGGAQRYVYDIATNLNPEKFEPVVALGGEGTLSEQLTHAGIKVIKIDSLGRDISLRKELDFSKELWRILRTERPDVFHVNSSKAGGIGTFLGRLARVPRVIFTAHGWAFNEDRPFWQRVVIKGLHWLTVIFSHKTIAVSNAIVKQMNWPFAAKKMKVINPGRTIGAMYSKSEARQKLSEVCPALSKVQSDPWTITIAELHPIKRLSVLIEAIKETKDKGSKLRSVIIGDGQLKSELEQKIKNYDLESHIFLTGSITEAARFLKAGDLFILPSKSESYGYVLHEAGLAGLPVIATNVGGIKDVITSHKTGVLIPPDRPDLLSEQILDFLDKKQKWSDFAYHLNTTMTERTTERMVRATETIYSLSLSL